jgi:hypothetical protein
MKTAWTLSETTRFLQLNPGYTAEELASLFERTKAAVESKRRQMKRQRPELTDHAVEKLIGKNSGYLSNCRSTLRGLTFLQSQGISKEQAEALTQDEIREMRAKILAGENGKGRRTKTFHRGGKVPKKSFRMYSPNGPAIMVICSSKKIKHCVWMKLSRLQQELV